MTYETDGTPKQNYSSTKGASLVRVLVRGFSSHDILSSPYHLKMGASGEKLARGFQIFQTVRL